MDLLQGADIDYDFYALFSKKIIEFFAVIVDVLLIFLNVLSPRVINDKCYWSYNDT